MKQGNLVPGLPCLRCPAILGIRIRQKTYKGKIHENYIGTGSTCDDLNFSGSFSCSLKLRTQT